MKCTLILAALIITSVSTISIAQTDSIPEAKPSRERLGVRIGYSATSNNLKESFGSGVNLALHFVTNIKKPLSIDITLGAIYLGSTDNEITRDFFGMEFDSVTMRILMLTAAPMLELPIGDRTDIYVSAGLGFYASSLILDQSLNEFDLTNNHYGVNAGAGIFRRIFTNWYLDFGVSLHKFWTDDKYDPYDPDWIFLYSGGDSDPLFWTVTGGAALGLF